MWLLTLLLASMASGLACPDCRVTVKQVTCLGNALPNTADLRGVDHLAIADCDNVPELNEFLEGLQNNTVLVSLSLTNCSLCVMNVSLSGFDGIRRLNLSGNHFAEMRHAVTDDLTNLTVLDVSENAIKSIDADAFNGFANLLWLRLRQNVIAKVDVRGFEGLGSLENLDLADNRLDTLPSGAFTPLDALQKLDLSGNKLHVLGASWFETLTRLRELDVSRNGIARAASGVLQPLPGLSVLRLAENPLKERDVSLLLGTGRRLETVDASRTGLVRVPSALTRSVRELRLAGNKLMSIRSGDLDSYPLLRLLDISNNKLSEVEDDALGRLEVLEELDISGNRLSNVPRSLPSSLTVLDLSRNTINVIKANDLQGLYNLRNLSLNDNAIESIEEGSLAQLPSLHMLDISNNPIKSLTANTLSGPNNLAILRMSGLLQLEDRGNAGDMVFPVPAPERLLILDASYSPVLAGQFLADDAALSACKRLLILNLIQANISTIRQDLGYVMPQLHTLGLSGNHWNCTGDLTWLVEWLRIHEEILPMAQCSAPENFTGTYLRKMPITSKITTPKTTTTPNPSLSSSSSATLISRKTDAIGDTTGISTASDFQTTEPLPTRHSTLVDLKVMRSYTRSAVVTRETNVPTTSVVPAARVNVIDSTREPVQNGKQHVENKRVVVPKGSDNHDPLLDNSIMSNDIANTIAEELNGKVTDPGARLAEPLSAGAHPGMLVLVGAALGAAAVLTVVLSRRAANRKRDKYHRHENIEVHSLTPTTELW